MSTRSIIVFKDDYSETHIYVHSDGYPSCRLVQIQEFLEWNKPRNGDVAYSAANFIFWKKLVSIQSFNEWIGPGKTRATIEDMLKPRADDENMHRGIGIVDSKFDDYAYKYIVDFDKETIHVTGYEQDVTVAFGQVVEFDDQDKIVQEETPIPA